MVALTVIVAAGILFLLRVLFAFWIEAKSQSRKPAHGTVDSRKSFVAFIPADRSARILAFESRLRNAAMAANDAEFAEFHSSKRAL